MNIPIYFFPHAANLNFPSYATLDSAGVDLIAAIEDDIVLAAGERKLIPTGISIALDKGTEAQIRSRSGLALNHGVHVLNAPGTIDADYRGEIKVLLMNSGGEPFIITPCMRIAQMVIAKYQNVTFEKVDSLDATHRGIGGFGSTGLF